MKLIFPYLLIVFATTLHAQKNKEAGRAGNPVFPGWYADPEGIIFDKQYWIYPTFSAPYEKQVFLGCFFFPRSYTWTKHESIMDTSSVKWAKRAMWAPAIIEKEGNTFCFLAPMIFKAK